MLARKEKLIPISTPEPGVDNKWFFDVEEGDTLVNVRAINHTIDVEEFIRRFLACPRNRFIEYFLV